MKFVWYFIRGLVVGIGMVILTVLVWVLGTPICVGMRKHPSDAYEWLDDVCSKWLESDR